MITKEEFIQLMTSRSIFTETDLAELNQQLDNAYEAAVIALQAMPGIGFLSVQQRINAFMSVCHHLDRMMEDEEINLSGTQLALMIMRFGSKKFEKAMAMFEIRAPRFDIVTRAGMPRPAREYLAGMMATSA